MLVAIMTFPLFLLAAFLCFTMPGVFLLEKAHFQFKNWEKYFLATSLGLASFTLLSYIGIVLHLNFLAILIVIITIIIALETFLESIKKLAFPNLKQTILLIIIFFVGIVGQMAVIAPSGIEKNGDLVFWSAHGHDSMWHISLMEEIKKGYPLQNPVFAGEKLVNYHFFSDIAPTIFSEYFRFSNLDLYFRFFPSLYSLLLGALAYFLGKRMGGSFAAGIWATIFTYFAGSFGWIITWIQNRSIGGETIFWATQIQSSIGNPPQIAIFVVLLAFMFFFLDFLKDQKNWSKLIICVLLAGSLIEFKVYGGVIVLGSLLLVGSWQFLKERRLQLLLLAVSSSILSAVLYLPNTVGSMGFLIWEPWWYIRTMIVIPGRLNLLDWELRRQTYLSENNIKRVILLESTSFSIFLLGNLGMRFIGLLEVGKIFSSVLKDYFHLLLILTIGSSFILPMLFLQKGVASNSIQFMQYFLLLTGIMAGIGVGRFTQKLESTKQIIIGIVIILIAVPTQAGLIYSFYINPPLAKIDSGEQTALKFIKENTLESSVIITPSYNKYLNLKIATPPIWAWFDTGYVSALSARRTFISDTEQIDIMGYDFKNRLTAQKEIFEGTDSLKFIKTLKDNHINYLYFPRILRPAINLQQTPLKQIFSNNSVEIWKVI